MDSFAAGKHHKTYLSKVTVLTDRRRLGLAFFIGLIINLTLLGAGELFFHFSEQYLYRTEKTAPVLWVVLGDPVQENFLLLRSSAQDKIIAENENAVPLQPYADETSEAAAGVENPLAISSGTGQDVAGTGLSPGTASYGGFAGTSGYSAGTEERNRLYETIYALIEREKQYPALARRRNIEGQVDVFIKVSPGGKLEESNISSSSGSPILDRAAINLVKNIFPLDMVLQSETAVNVIIRYSLKD